MVEVDRDEKYVELEEGNMGGKDKEITYYRNLVEFDDENHCITETDSEAIRNEP